MISAEGGSAAAAFQADVSRDADCAALIVEAKSTLGTDRHPGQQCRHRRRRRRPRPPGRRGGLGPHPDRQSQIRLDDHQARRCRSCASKVAVRSSTSPPWPHSPAAIRWPTKSPRRAMNRLTTSVANANAGHGVRCNAVLPGLMDTPMAISGIASAIGLVDRRRCAKRVTPAYRCAARWEPPGTPPTPLCSWPRTRPISSPACCCRWTAGMAARVG